MPGYVIIPGSPERTVKIAANWDNAREVAHNRHYVSKRGEYKGMEQGTTSTGIGALSAEICINELKKAGVHTVLRVGSTGCIDAVSYTHLADSWWYPLMWSLPQARCQC